MPFPLAAGALALCLLPFSLAAAGDGVPEALRAASPDTPAAPVRSLNLPRPVDSPDTVGDLPGALARWQQANRDVAEFPRGHADLLRWEARQPAPTATPANGGPVLDADQAWRRALRARPDLLLPPSASPAEAVHLGRTALAHRQAVHAAWLDAVAARELLRHEQAQAQAADTAAELGRRMVQAGNWSQARLLREQLAQARQQAAVLRAQREADRSAEALWRLMAVWQADDIATLGARLPDRLPDLPARPGVPDNLESQVLLARADGAAQRAQAAREARAVDAATRQAWHTALAAAADALPPGAQAQPLSLAQPALQRRHGLASAMAHEAERLRDAAALRSQARELWRERESRHALAEHAEQVLLPLQTALEQETLLRYNGMLQSTWDLIEAARARLSAAAEVTRSRHAFWQAQLAWDTLLAGGEPLALAATEPGNGPATASAAAH